MYKVYLQIQRVDMNDTKRDVRRKRLQETIITIYYKTNNRRSEVQFICENEEEC